MLAATLLATTVTNPLAEVVAADAVQQPNQKGISSEKNNDITRGAS
ncbi:hypothetical protein [Lactobacillus crispatus]|nr:hypothetical protein [Lactobacillus crispatus]WEB32861.1 hypothetical protein PUW44_00820 [Lactobacillus crispatus]